MLGLDSFTHTLNAPENLTQKNSVTRYERKKQPNLIILPFPPTREKFHKQPANYAKQDTQDTTHHQEQTLEKTNTPAKKKTTPW